MTALFTCRRLNTDGQSIINEWLGLTGERLCFCLEPGMQREPHPGIVAGNYPLRFNVTGEKHKEYNRYYADKFGIGWHRGMIEICEVPGRDGIELHVGNTIIDTLGCNLSGSASIPPPGNGSGHWEVSGSRAAYEKVYPILRDATLAGDTRLRVVPIGGAAA